MTAVLSAKPFDPAELFAGEGRSLLAQSDAVKGREQRDGWGAAFYSAGKLELLKSPAPVFAEKERFTRYVSGPRRGLSLAHIRQASNPLGLSSKELLGAANTQPFQGNGFVFAHNGTLEIPAEIKTTLGRYEKFVKGVNDSEVLFWQIMKMLDAYGDPALALEMAIEETKTVWLSCKGRYPAKKYPYRGLNVFLSDGKALWVLCHYSADPKKEALLTPGWEFGRIAWRKEAGRAVFSSEPADGGAWKKMSDLDIAEARLNGTGVDIKIRTIKRYSK